jgi:hypothetical protein
VPVKNITPIKLGMVIKLRAISPKFHTNVKGSIAPKKLKNTYTTTIWLYGFRTPLNIQLNDLHILQLTQK